MNGPFHQSALRKRRVSQTGSVYAIVKNTGYPARPLIRNSADPKADAPTVDIVINSFKWHHENGHFVCIAYTVMPDHYHLIFVLEDNRTLDQVMGAIGGFTSREINKVRGWTGQFWQEAYHDRMVRDEEEFENQVNYVWENPMRAGFVKRAEDWPYTGIYPDWGG